MTLPSSGALSLDAIQTEFGGSNPISMSEYYRGGSYVPTHPGTSGISSSGSIDVNMFYSKSRIWYAYVTIGSNTTDYNLASALASTLGAAISTLSVPIYAYVTISSGIYVSATSTGTAAFSTGTGWPSSSYIELTNNGYIIGKGGNGGAGTYGGGASGSAGGPAISLSYSMTINNTSGYVYGAGGGGGGGGSNYCYPAGVNFTGGGGGGGGASSPYSTSAGGAGGTGYPDNTPATAGGSGGSTAGAGGNYGTSINYYGETLVTAYGGYGGAGGAYGAAGSSGGANNGTSPGGYVINNYGAGGGGAAGNAANLNTNTLTWTGGNNGTQVKGSVS